MAPGQAPTVVTRPKIFGEGSRVRAMRENVACILKQRRLRTIGGRIDFHLQQWRKYHTSTCTSCRDMYKVCLWLATGVKKDLDTVSYGSSRGYVVASLA